MMPCSARERVRLFDALRVARFAAPVAAALVLWTSPAAAADVPMKAGIPASGLILRGNLGEHQIQMQLRPKADEDGVEGEYFVFGAGQRVLLAGEFEDGHFWLEESANGTDVSGEWDGERKGDLLQGTWRGAAPDGQPRAFSLHIMKSPPLRKP